MITVTESELENRFETYLDLAVNGEEILITRQGKPVAKLSPAFLSDQMVGTLKGQKDFEEELAAELRKKYGMKD